MKLKDIKLELFYLRKAFLEHHQGFKYIAQQYWVARRILRCRRLLAETKGPHQVSMHLLTCHRDTVMTLWSLASFFAASEIRGELFIHNDGSLTKRDLLIIKRCFPDAQIINAERFVKDFAHELQQYPILKTFRVQFPHYFSLKKIIDPFIVSRAPVRLIIDSDILWFQRPQEIEEAVEQGAPRSYMQTSNKPIVVAFKDGGVLDERLALCNAGVILYHRNNFDVAAFSNFLERLDICNPRNLHFADQAGHAYCLKHLETLPSSTYCIKGEVGPQTIMRHYTGPRRVLFYTEGLPIIVRKLEHLRLWHTRR